MAVVIAENVRSSATYVTANVARIVPVGTDVKYGGELARSMGSSDAMNTREPVVKMASAC
jgi:hypothetical protein